MLFQRSFLRWYPNFGGGLLAVVTGQKEKTQPSVGGADMCCLDKEVVLDTLLDCTAICAEIQVVLIPHRDGSLQCFL